MDFELMIDSAPRLWEGAKLTIILVFSSLLTAFFPALGLAMMRRSKNALLWMPAFGFIYLFRGTPFIVQMFFFYFGLGQIEWLRESEFLRPIYSEAVYYGFIALFFNTLAYQAEIQRGGIESVPNGEVEAGRAAGMSGVKLFRRIIFPNVIRRVVPGYANEAILLMKASAVVSLITVMDLMGHAQRINSRFFAPIEMYLSAAVVYLAIAILITILARSIEYALTPHLRANQDVAGAEGGLKSLLKKTASMPMMR